MELNGILAKKSTEIEIPLTEKSNQTISLIIMFIPILSIYTQIQRTSTSSYVYCSSC